VRLLAIEAQNFLSLHNFRIEDLDERLNFLVGPNGCGKTSVFRVVRAIRDAFDSYSTRGTIEDLSEQCTRGTHPIHIELAMRVAFDQPDERELLISFLGAALAAPEALRSLTVMRAAPPKSTSENTPSLEAVEETRASEEGLRNFADWFLNILSAKEASFLFQGDLKLLYHMGELYPTIRLSYTFDCEGTPLTIVTSTTGFGGGQLWAGTLPETSQGGGYTLEYAWRTVFVESPHLKAFAQLISGQQTAGIADLSAASLLKAIAEQHVEVSAKLQQPIAQAQKRLIELCGFKAGDINQPLSFARLISKLLRRSLVFTNNQRTPLKRFTQFTPEEVGTIVDNLDDEARVPLWLYHLSIGKYQEKQQFQRLQVLFTELIGGKQTFDVQAKHLPASSGGGIEVSLRMVDEGGDTSLVYEGAGIWEALLLATLLDASTGRIILLDEPAANLHPGMQRKVLEMLHKTSGQVIAVTHSSHMLPTRPIDFQHVVRLQKESGSTATYRLGNLSQYRIRPDKLEQELSSSSDVAGLLFASAVILIEGDTETAALSEWFPNSKAGKKRDFADLNIALYAVGGKTAFPFYMRFLTAFGVPWVVICDGDALTINGGIWGALRELASINHDPPHTATFPDLKALAEGAGVYTANTDFDQNFEKIPEVKNYIDDPNNELPTSSKVRDGRLIGQQLLPPPPEIERILQGALQRLGLE
jgi:energy-coupling factor transporter ATP-binding protein EcfA2